MRRHTRSAFAATISAAAVTMMLGACDSTPEPEQVTFAVSADSIIELQRDTLPNGALRVECLISLRTNVTGPEGAHAVVRGGRIDYFWWQTGAAASSYEWNPETAHRLWSDSIIPVGELRLSRSHGFGQSAPGDPVRASVTFRYGTSDSDEERETEPFRFYCY
ncbi:hypothetical protein BH23GEM10_BH23GEM10_05460 [soil metagenome]